MIGVFCANLLLGLPSGINYQGRLTNPSGVALSGNKSFSIAIYTAATGGQAIYSENIGSVSLDANGVYSFQFGVNGTSVSGVSLPLGVTATGQAVYSKVLDEAALAGSVKITDGVYSWSQSAGSNSPSSFLGSYDLNSRTVTAVYLGQVPSASRTISVEYSRNSAGLASALDMNQSQWLELTVDSSTQSPRERILSVPYALNASNALEATDSAGRLEKRLNDLENFQLYSSTGNPEGAGGLIRADFTANGALPSSVNYDFPRDSAGLRVAVSGDRQYSFSQAENLNGINAYLLSIKISVWRVTKVRFVYSDGSSSSISVTYDNQFPEIREIQNPNPSKKVYQVGLSSLYNDPYNPNYYLASGQIYYYNNGSVVVSLPASFADKKKGIKLLVDHSFSGSVILTAEVVKADNSSSPIAIGKTADLNGVAATSVRLNISAPSDPSLVIGALASLIVFGTN